MKKIIFWSLVAGTFGGAGFGVAVFWASLVVGLGVAVAGAVRAYREGAREQDARLT